MSNLEISTHPQHNANVFASAGSGKTWLLITRICRLLLAGAEPQHILAITFTRKSAAEMRARLFGKLSAWAAIPEQALYEELESIGESPSKENIKTARSLYEKCIFSEQPIRISTFHAFCEEVIRAFPLESELPTSFELTEHSQLYINQAWQHVLQQSEREEKLYDALQELYKFCFGFRGARNALISFLFARSEWRAYTYNKKDTFGFAYKNLLHDIGTEKDSGDDFLNSSQCHADLQRYQKILRTSTTKTHQNWADKLELYFNLNTTDNTLRLEKLKDIFLTSKNELRKLTISKKWQTSLSEDDYQHLTDTHSQIGANLLNTLDARKHNHLLSANQAWFYAGEQLLKHYQNIKFSQGVIDFSDLEWETYRLLQHDHNVQWVQYKLGQRIRHFLVDEFQDTNPIQWHLLKPLIEASQEQYEGDANSLFLVGDIKQSIYRFRGANPEIQNLASQWSQQALNSDELSNNRSWRSSPAIINLVNEVFTHDSIQETFSSFQPHSCQHQDRWGKIKIFPLIPIEEKSDQKDFRDPLTTPYLDSEVSAHFNEGCLVAEEIQKLIDEKTPVYEGNTVRAANYSDVLILIRNRSHLNDIKAGLLQAHIPFNSHDTSRLLDYLEVQDMMALLQVLIDPYDDLKLAQVLRSPVFNAPSEDLIELRKSEADTWIDKLIHVAKNKNSDHPLSIAISKIKEWQRIADHIPVHDLMSHIYNSRNVLNRYRNSVADFEAEHVCNRLNQFLHQCLELDSGRYSSIARFLRKIKTINPEVVADSDENKMDAVEIITVHSAKGLEAPIVFLADSGPNHEPPEQFKALSEWPAESTAPTSFMMSCSKNNMSEAASAFKDSISDHNEEQNLLYVALTRAKQILIVTGSQSSRKTHCWHDQLRQSLNLEDDEVYVQEHLVKPDINPVSAATEQADITEIPENLFQPIRNTSINAEPVEKLKSGTREGIIIHKLLELLSCTPTLGDQALINRISLETRFDCSSDELEIYKQEALNCLNNENIKEIFELKENQHPFNEFAIATANNQQNINVIDRLIISEESAWIIDFKTQGDVNEENAAKKAAEHELQLERYKAAVNSLYPNLPIRCSIVFTKIPKLVDLQT